MISQLCFDLEQIRDHFSQPTWGGPRNKSGLGFALSQSIAEILEWWWWWWWWWWVGPRRAWRIFRETGHPLYKSTIVAYFHKKTYSSENDWDRIFCSGSKPPREACTENGATEIIPWNLYRQCKPHSRFCQECPNWEINWPKYPISGIVMYSTSTSPIQQLKGMWNLSTDLSLLLWPSR